MLQCFASVFVSGMFIATKHATRRNAFILMLSLALGIGVAMEPNLFEGGGVASFHGKNLRHNIGFWPKYKTCKTFPSTEVFATDVDAFCTAMDGTVYTPWDEESTCGLINGTWTAAVQSSWFEEVKTCTNNNGFCCLEYDKGAKSARTTAIIMLKTPYCIGFMIALILNLLIPEDKEGVIVPGLTYAAAAVEEETPTEAVTTGGIAMVPKYEEPTEAEA